MLKNAVRQDQATRVVRPVLFQKLGAMVQDRYAGR